MRSSRFIPVASHQYKHLGPHAAVKAIQARRTGRNLTPIVVPYFLNFLGTGPKHRRLRAATIRPITAKYLVISRAHSEPPAQLPLRPCQLPRMIVLAAYRAPDIAGHFVDGIVSIMAGSILLAVDPFVPVDGYNPERRKISVGAARQDQPRQLAPMLMNQLSHDEMFSLSKGHQWFDRWRRRRLANQRQHDGDRQKRMTPFRENRATPPHLTQPARANKGPILAAPAEACLARMWDSPRRIRVREEVRRTFPDSECLPAERTA